MVIKVLYTIFLGLLVVLFVWWALASFYPAPEWASEYPKYEEHEYGWPRPNEPSSEALRTLSPAEAKARLQAYEAQFKEYEAREKELKKLRKEFRAKVERHDRNVSIISLLISLMVMALSVVLSSGLPVISEGLMLGGLFTLVSSMGWSFVRSPKVAVIVVGVGLVVTIVLGYYKFVKPTARPATGA